MSNCNKLSYFLQRPIVEFSLENKLALLAKEKRVERMKVGAIYDRACPSVSVYTFKIVGILQDQNYTFSRNRREEYIASYLKNISRQCAQR